VVTDHSQVVAFTVGLNISDRHIYLDLRAKIVRRRFLAACLVLLYFHCFKVNHLRPIGDAESMW